jgi:hypothetical protein
MKNVCADHATKQELSYYSSVGGLERADRHLKQAPNPFSVEVEDLVKALVDLERHLERHFWCIDLPLLNFLEERLPHHLSQNDVAVATLRVKEMCQYDSSWFWHVINVVEKVTSLGELIEFLLMEDSLSSLEERLKCITRGAELLLEEWGLYFHPVRFYPVSMFLLYSSLENEELSKLMAVSSCAPFDEASKNYLSLIMKLRKIEEEVVYKDDIFKILVLSNIFSVKEFEKFMNKLLIWRKRKKEFFTLGELSYLFRIAGYASSWDEDELEVWRTFQRCILEKYLSK